MKWDLRLLTGKLTMKFSPSLPCNMRVLNMEPDDELSSLTNRLYHCASAASCFDFRHLRDLVISPCTRIRRRWQLLSSPVSSLLLGQSLTVFPCLISLSVSLLLSSLVSSLRLLVSPFLSSSISSTCLLAPFCLPLSHLSVNQPLMVFSCLISLSVSQSLSVFSCLISLSVVSYCLLSLQRSILQQTDRSPKFPQNVWHMSTE